MKKRQWINLAVLFFLAAVLSACSGPSTVEEPSPAPATMVTPAPTPIPTPKKDIPNTIGLYIRDRSAGVRQLVQTYRSDWIAGQDIKCFEAFATQTPVLSDGQFGDVWRDFWNGYADAASCKIGYCLYFTLADGTSSSQIIKKPEDTLPYKRYIETYLYDDACQQPGVWYSHLEPEDMTADTVCTSIKLTAGPDIAQVKEIRLEAFVYSTADFDAETARYQISVKRKESA